MLPQPLRGIAASALAALSLALLPAAAGANETYGDMQFNNGWLLGLENNDGYSEAGWRDLGFEFRECDTQPGELSCTGKVEVSLFSHPDTRCDPTTPESIVVWSDEISGNGVLASGPRIFPLEGCRDQTLVISVGTSKTFDPAVHSTFSSSSGRSIFSVATFGRHPAQEAETAVRNANPPAVPPPEFVPPRPVVSPDCRALAYGNVTFAFDFRRLGCHKATNLAMAAFRSKAPNGYRCKRSAHGTRCWRKGEPRKYFRWWES